MSAFTSLFGETVLTPDGESVPVAEHFTGLEAVGIYFSAHWCPPCRGFTPILTSVYNTIKAAGKAFEIVFVSSDSDADAFKEYSSSMPWLSLPFSAKTAIRSLKEQFRVEGIPTFVMLDGAGELITRDGRSAVADDTDGARFPWRPPTVWELLSGATEGTPELVDRAGATKTVADVRAAADNIMLYFSAHWCPPCKAFTPTLITFYERMRAGGKRLELVFVSSDHEKGSFDEYMGTMPWLAIPFDDERRRTILSQRFEVEGIPTLLVLDAEGNVANSSARMAVEMDPEGATFPWAPEPWMVLSPINANILNEEPGIVIFLDGVAEADAAALDAALPPLAQAHHESVSAAGGSPLRFLRVRTDDPDHMAVSLRKFFNLEVGPMVVAFTVQRGIKAILPMSPDDVLSAERIRAFADEFVAGTVETVGIRD